MYHKIDYAPVTRWNADERIIGKVGLHAGIIAVLLFLGVVGVIVWLSLGYSTWAVVWGVGAVILIVLTAIAPLKVFKKKPEDMPDRR